MFGKKLFVSWTVTGENLMFGLKNSSTLKTTVATRVCCRSVRETAENLSIVALTLFHLCRECCAEKR